MRSFEVGSGLRSGKADAGSGRASGRGWRGRPIAIAAALVLALAPLAEAGPLPFRGSLSVQLGGGALAIPGSATADAETLPGGHLASLGVPAGAFAAEGLTIAVGAPALAPIGGVQLTFANAAGVLAPGGALALPGVAKVCLFAACGAAPPSNLSVPLGVVGAGGTTVASSGAIAVTLVGAPWTLGTAAVGDLTTAGFAHGPLSATSSTALASGELQLVTPIFLSTSLGPDAVLPGFAFLTLHFVPEPGTALLLAAGLAAVAAGARRPR